MNIYVKSTPVVKNTYIKHAFSSCSFKIFIYSVILNIFEFLLINPLILLIYLANITINIDNLQATDSYIIVQIILNLYNNFKNHVLSNMIILCILCLIIFRSYILKTLKILIKNTKLKHQENTNKTHELMNECIMNTKGYNGFRTIKQNRQNHKILMDLTTHIIKYIIYLTILVIYILVFVPSYLPILYIILGFTLLTNIVCGYMYTPETRQNTHYIEHSWFLKKFHFTSPKTQVRHSYWRFYALSYVMNILCILVIIIMVMTTLHNHIKNGVKDFAVYAIFIILIYQMKNNHKIFTIIPQYIDVKKQLFIIKPTPTHPLNMFFVNDQVYNCSIKEYCSIYFTEKELTKIFNEADVLYELYQLNTNINNIRLSSLQRAVMVQIKLAMAKELLKRKKNIILNKEKYKSYFLDGIPGE